MRVLVLLAPLLLAACTSQATLAREAREACSGDNQNCTIQAANNLSIEALRANGDSLTVTCESVLAPLDQNYLSSCSRQLAKLANNLSQKWKNSIEPINAADIAQEDFHTAVDTIDRGYDFYGIRAKLPLRWRE